ncbi:MAG TPA: amino acid permease [Terriglobia bacterium]|nr:amino acid permease [Terriglobia bacterium]
MEKRTELIKGLGLYGAASVVAGTMIGTAIFVVPSKMLNLVGTPWMVLLVWVFAGILSLFGALGYAELGAAIPEAGGEYVYIHRAYSPMLGFLYSWTQFVVAKSTSIAAIATGFVLYLSYFFPTLTEVVWQAQIGSGEHSFAFKLTGLQLGATVMILLLSVINVLGVRRAGAVQTLFTASKILVLAVIIVLGLTLGHGSWDHFKALPATAFHGGTLAAFGVATVSALWAYDGWNNLSMVAGEVKNPQRNMPAALIFGTLLVITVYLLVNMAYFYVLAPADIARTQTVAADCARVFMGKAGGAFVAVGVIISTFATLNGSILSGSRIPFATARDGLFPQPLAKLSPRFATPVVAILSQAFVAGLFALSGQYDTLYTKAIFSEFLFYALVTAGIFVLRRREPNLPRSYRTWGYPVVPAIFVGLSVLLLINTFVEQRTDSLWGLALVGSGIPLYFIWKIWQRKTNS